MAEMQRRRDKKKKEDESVDILTDVLDQVTKEKNQSSSSLKKPQPISRPLTTSSQPKTRPSRIIKPSVSVTPTEKPSLPKLEPGKVDPRVKPVLPGWANKPWRWMIPDDPNLKEQWLITWGEFILDFARVLNFHILDLQEVSLVYPFKNPLLHKKLTLPQLVMISEYLIEIEKAKWWDSEKTRLRVYWKTLKSFTDDLYNYAFQNGYDMVTAYDIVKMSQPWSALPPSDVRMLMKLLVDSKRASWADSERKTIQFHYD